MVSQELWGEFERTGSIRAYLDYVSGIREQLVHRNFDTEWDGIEEISATSQHLEARNEGRNHGNRNRAWNDADW